VLLIITAFCQYWVNEKLPGLINKKDSAYYITYKDMDISLLKFCVHADSIVLVPKAAKNDRGKKDKAGLYITIPSLDIDGINFLSMIFSNKIRVNSIKIEKPEVLLLKDRKNSRDNAKTIKKEVDKPLRKLFYADRIQIGQGSLKMIYPDKEVILSVKNFELNLDRVHLSQKTLSRKLPFTYATYEINCDSLFYKPNAIYHISTGNIHATQKMMTVDQMEYLCDRSRKQFLKSLETERDLYNITAKKLSMTGLDWGYSREDELFVHTGLLKLDHADADIYRDKTKPDDHRRKRLYNDLLRDIKFDLRIDTLALRNSKLEYEEQVNDNGPGKLRFSPFDLTALHISSGYGHKKLRDVAIAIDARFMAAAPLKIQWSFNVLDKMDSFHIKGSVKDLPAENLEPFVKPYMNLSAKGVLDEIYFDFHGNDDGSKGSFGINYDDLKFTVYKKNDQRKKNKLLTAVAKIFIKKDTNEKVKHADIEVAREKDKSFYNLFWKSIADGLKKILL
jgi:hypothetical protein